VDSNDRICSCHFIDGNKAHGPVVMMFLSAVV